MSEAIDADDREQPGEIGCQGAMRVGQNNGTVRQWNRKGSRPHRGQDQRYRSADRCGASCPAFDKGMTPPCRRPGMQVHLGEIPETVTPGARARPIIDQPGWQMTDKLAWPADISPLPLPPRSAERNPV